MPFSVRNIIPVLMLLASVATILMYLKPHYGNIQDLQYKKSEYERSVDNANEVRILRGQLLSTYDSFSQEDKRRLAIMLPQKPDGITLAKDISALASVFGIKIDSFTFRDASAASTPSTTTGPDGNPVTNPSPTGGVGVLELSISFQSSYPEFLNFLHELERNLELSDVVSVSITRGSVNQQKETGTPGKGVASSTPTVSTYGFSLTIDTYWNK